MNHIIQHYLTRTWIGSIFLKEEDGYKIVLRALKHYKKRLRSIAESPELAGAATFAQVIEQEAKRTYPKVNDIITIIPKALYDDVALAGLEKEIPLLQKALTSYKSDITKAESGTHEYYTKLVLLSEIPTEESERLDDAIQRIAAYYNSNP